MKNEEDIVGALAVGLGSNKEDVVSATRRQEIVRVRDLIAFLLREYGGMSYPAIGRLLGGRDHTTIIHAHRKIAAQIQKTPDIYSGFNDLFELATAVKERRLAAEQELADKIKEITAEVTKHKLVVKEIPPRNMRILELYREGLTLENIGGEVGVTRERVRQVVASTIRQMAINESILKDIVVDSEIMYEEMEKKRKASKELKNPKKIKPIKVIKQWSRYYPSCKKCGTTALPHVRTGLCEQCIGQFRAGRRESILAEHFNKCDKCATTRSESASLYGRDLYITKERAVLCRPCFIGFASQRMSNYKFYEWSRFYPNCQKCGTDKIPHSDKGLCEGCSERMTPTKRESILIKNGNNCQKCGLSRVKAKSVYKKDLFIIKTGEVLCRGCFQKNVRRNMLSRGINK